MADTADTFFGKLNGPWHKRALQAFLVIVIAHWAEHLVQAWLVHSEVLHYGYAMIMLVGIWTLLRARRRADAVQLRAPSAPGDDLTGPHTLFPSPFGRGETTRELREVIRSYPLSLHCGEGDRG